MSSEGGVAAVGGALRGGPASAERPHPYETVRTWPYPRADSTAPPAAGTIPTGLPRLQTYPRPPLALTEALVAFLQRAGRSYQPVSRLAQIAWTAHRAKRRVPDPDLGVWPLFWLTPVLEHRGESIERLL